MKETEVPSGWCEVQLEDLVLNPKSDLVDGPFGSNLKSSEYLESGVPVLKIQNIKANRFVRKRLSYVTTKKAAELSRHSFLAGDLMITKLGEPLGLCCEVPADLKHGIFVADLMRLRPSGKIVHTSFLLHAINSVVVQSQFKEITKGTTRQRVNLSIVRSIKIALPPLDEQCRIVAKIEELFSELDKGVESLKQARAQLAVYRQALLKHAFEGKLTEEWRAANAARLESRDEILTRIRNERDLEHKQRLDEWAANETDAVKRPRELIPWVRPTDEEVAELPALPTGWAWVPFSNLCQTVRNGISAKPEGGLGDKILRISAVRPMKVDLEDHRFIRSDGEEFEDYILKAGDLLFTRYNGTRRFVGVCGQFKGSERCLFPDKLIQGRLAVASVRPEFVEAAFGCGASRRFVESRIRTTAGQAGVSGGDIKAVPVPICSAEEQDLIVRVLDESLSNIDTLESDIDTNLKKAEALRQSILKKAFAGELVPQDPNDEPASVLLERIRAEREAAEKNGNGRSAGRGRRKKA